MPRFAITLLGAALILEMTASCTQVKKEKNTDDSGALPAVTSGVSSTTLSDPTGFSAKSLADEIDLSWVSGGLSASGYTIAYIQGNTAPGTCSSGTIISPAAIAGATAYKLTGLTPATTYSFRLCAVSSAGGLSGGVVLTADTSYALPPDPSGLTISRDSTSQLTLSWTSGGGSTQSFKMAYVAGPVPPADCKSGIVSSTAQTSLTVTGLTSYSTYSFRVCALNGNSPADFSTGATASARTLAGALFAVYDDWQSNSGVQRFAFDPKTEVVSGQQSIVTENPHRQRRGIVTMPGQLLVVNDGTSGASYLSEIFSNDAVNGSPSPQEAFLSTTNNFDHQAASLTWDGAYIMVPQYNNNYVNVYQASTGQYVTQFGGPSDLTNPISAVEDNAGHVFVSSSNNGKIVEYSHSGTSFTKVKDFNTGFVNPYVMDFCEAKGTLLVTDLGNSKVSSCTMDGTCTVKTTVDTSIGPSGTSPVSVHADPNAADCAFFVGYSTGGSGGLAIARFHDDGSLDNATWASLSTSVSNYAHIFQMEFEKR